MSQSHKRLALLAVVLLIVLGGSGIGMPIPPAELLEPTNDRNEAVSDRTDDQDETPTPPRVETTPSEPTTDTTVTNTDSKATVTAALNLTVGDPGEIRNRYGRVDTLSGPISGSLNWTGSVDSAVVVVHVWVPEQGWHDVTRVTVDGSSPVSLDAVLGNTTYATGNRADAFRNPEDGTTRQTTGYLSVTAVLSDGGVERTRTTATDTFTTSVTNLESGSASVTSHDAASTPLDLVVGGSTQRTNIFELGDGSTLAAPGSSGVTRRTLTNGGDRRGDVLLSSVSYSSDENGQTGPEAAVDETGGDPGVDAGELHEALEIRVSVEFADGSSRYVIGAESAYRTIASLANEVVEFGDLGAGESVDLVIEFRIPSATGNEIQSDILVVDFEFQLVERA